MIDTTGTHVYGEFTSTIAASDEYLTLHFSPSNAPRKQRWRNYGLSADFLGDYFAAFFPGDTPTNGQINQRDTVKAAVSFIANELLENAVKYSETVGDRPITISLYLYKQKIVFQVVNFSDRSTTKSYQQFIEELSHSDPDMLYAQQLEKTALGTGESCIGILTMINDYGASFSWQFQELDSTPEVVQVAVMVSLDV
ncbi:MULTISPECIES: ATP-binding protein [unclassified Leptolyngbya]|uniref:slr1658 superfamily regulator n=1 Tax=unclassified Leptolyngbya TaxID=2650499 RepID=UPI0016896C3E|nr:MULTISPECIES: ATP-binding protein [unclassified Leptolyngbya]MBD1912798.1 ATP-binding protein [Leptolyngbya sp. FACHB-8]MBD2157745.1 ATP-binding protein [Leptolyngbya sp. FACHB-16]